MEIQFFRKFFFFLILNQLDGCVLSETMIFFIIYKSFAYRYFLNTNTPTNIEITNRNEIDNKRIHLHE